MGRVIDLSGQSFGRWHVLSGCDRPSTRKKKDAWFWCKCACGVERAVSSDALRRGKSQSCGCLHSEVSAETGRKNRTHGHSIASNSPTYRSWRCMWQRCTNPRSNVFHLYGGRGISVCSEWKEFSVFLSDMGERPEGTSIDRIDGTGNYEPSNCRWADAITQAANSRCTRVLSYNGETLSVAGWARRLGVTHYMLSSRLRRNYWDLGAAILDLRGA